MIEEIANIYESIRQLSEDHLHNKYRVTKIRANTLDAEYPVPLSAYGDYKPDVFSLGYIDMEFRVDAMKLPINNGQEEAELTIRLEQGKLVVRRVVFTQQVHGWVGEY